jgi:hypothetical protein
MKYSLVQKGIRAERAVKFPHLVDGGKVIDIDCVVRPLLDEEESEVLSYAVGFAKKKGGKPESGDPLFDLGYMRRSISIGVLDKDSPVDAREPFFDGGVEQIMRELSRESVTYLFAVLEAWQDEISPRANRLSDAALISGLQLLANGGSEAETFLDGLGPAMLRSYVRSMARLLLDARAPKSTSG